MVMLRLRLLILSSIFEPPVSSTSIGTELNSKMIRQEKMPDVLRKIVEESKKAMSTKAVKVIKSQLDRLLNQLTHGKRAAAENHHVLRTEKKNWKNNQTHKVYWDIWI